MGFLSKIFGSNKETIPEKSKIELILDKYVNIEDFNSIIKELELLDKNELTQNELEDWYFYRGVSDMRLGNRDIALEMFKLGFTKVPSSQRIAFSIGQEYEQKGEINEAIKYFSHVKFSHQTTNFFNRIIQYYYLSGKYDLGIKMVQPILDIIYSLGIIDGTFLHIRELPFFSHIYPVKIVFSHLSNSFDKEEFKKYKSKFEDDEILQLEKLITALIDKDYLPIIESTKIALEKLQKNKYPSAFQELQITLFQNKIETNLEHGLKKIDSIIITENDFHWLNGIKILGKAELAHRLKAPKIEQELLESFFEIQLLMFEPFISFEFGLVEYQEIIKPLCLVKKEKYGKK